MQIPTDEVSSSGSIESHYKIGASHTKKLYLKE